MKKSEVIISMPMTAYEEFSLYRDKYYELLGEIKGCFDTKLLDTNCDNIINVDVKELIRLSQSKLNVKYRSVPLKLNL